MSVKITVLSTESEIGSRTCCSFYRTKSFDGLIEKIFANTKLKRMRDKKSITAVRVGIRLYDIFHLYVEDEGDTLHLLILIVQVYTET